MQSNHEIELKHLQLCYKEEADNRLFMHAVEQSWLGFKRLMIIIIDTDVVVIDLHEYWELDIVREKITNGCQFILC